MHRSVFTAALLLSAIPAFAEAWIMVGEGRDRWIFVNTQTFERRGPIRRMHQLLNYRYRDAKGYQSYVYLVEYHCTQRTYRLLSSTGYVGPGAQGPSSGPTSGPPTSWKPIAKDGSLADQTFSQICSAKFLVE
jgi:hypothetical protein